MKKILCLSLVIIFVVFANNRVWAKSNIKNITEKSSPAYLLPYGMAGCGLWSLIIKGKDRESQLAIWILKHFIPNFQTSAMTTGTLNCVEPRPAYAKEEQQVFIEINYHQLAKEAAQGEGYHLEALAEIFGCKKDDFMALSKNKYQQIFSNSDTQTLWQNYINIIKSDEKLAKSCVRV